MTNPVTSSARPAQTPETQVAKKDVKPPEPPKAQHQDTVKLSNAAQAALKPASAEATDHRGRR